MIYPVYAVRKGPGSDLILKTGSGSATLRVTTKPFLLRNWKIKGKLKQIRKFCNKNKKHSGTRLKHQNVT